MYSLSYLLGYTGGWVFPGNDITVVNTQAYNISLAIRFINYN